MRKGFGENPVNEFHIHGSAQDKESILVGHAIHPEYPYEPLRQIKGTPRLRGLYYIEDFLYNADKHVEDNYEVYGLDAEKLLKREYASANRESTGIYSLSTF